MTNSNYLINGKWDWVQFVKNIRNIPTHVIVEHLNSIKPLGKPPYIGEDAGLYGLVLMALRGGPIVQYVIPDVLARSFDDGPLPLDIPLKQIVGMPFSPMAIASKENPNIYRVVHTHENGVLNVISNKGIGVIDLNRTVRELMDIGFGKFSSGMVSALMYITHSGDSFHNTVSETKGGKRERNKPRQTVIRGEVGGKFVTALKKYEKQQESEFESRPHGSPKPHIRSGHFHLYWTGKGRTVPKVQFLHPCLVNADSVGPDVEIDRRVSV